MAEWWAEAYRLRLLRGLDERVRAAGFERLAGVDEAGRGCLAGPVVAAAVVVRRDHAIPGVDDSKALPAEQRERLAEVVRRAYPAHAIAVVPADEIDRVNVLEATKLAMRRALSALEPLPEAALVDAVALPGLGFPVVPVIRGDQVSYAVACASILAKVARDRMMVELDRRYPLYGFASNKGYGAEEHRRALQEHGPCPVHRLTFRSVLPRLGERAPQEAVGGAR